MWKLILIAYVIIWAFLIYDLINAPELDEHGNIKNKNK